MRTGVKVLLAGEQQAAVTVAVEGLMDGKPLPELESFLTLDPKVILYTAPEYVYRSCLHSCCLGASAADNALQWKTKQLPQLPLDPYTSSSRASGTLISS